RPGGVGRRVQRSAGFRPASHRLSRMPGPALALVLCAAAIHAGWNALAKRARAPMAFLSSSVALATFALSPLGLAYLPDEGVPAAAMPILPATILIPFVSVSA